jgi:peptidoglycan hydrolase-like protein with peptidoglycan-binding domain
MVFTYKDCVEFIAYLGYDANTEDGALNLLCIQGCTSVDASATVIGSNDLRRVPNEPDKYNDTIILVQKVKGKTQIQCLLGTVDPGRYYTQTDPNPKGAAHLTFGQHWYVSGLHRGKPALRALNERNRVWRDKNGNFQPDTNEMVYEGAYGVNIHAGGKGEYIGKWSAGCINVCGGYDGKPYAAFLEAIRLHFHNSHGSIGVTIWRAIDFFKFRDGQLEQPTIVLGMKGIWVARMQEYLKHFDPSMMADGDFGPKTMKALLAFQTQKGLDADGWCGPATWFAMTGVKDSFLLGG